MTKVELDRLIEHHEYQTMLWSTESNGHKDHAKWAAGLRDIQVEQGEAKRAHREHVVELVTEANTRLLDAVRKLLPFAEEDSAWEYFDYMEESERKSAIFAGRAAIAEAEEVKVNDAEELYREALAKITAISRGGTSAGDNRLVCLAEIQNIACCALAQARRQQKEGAKSE